jgi:ABC-type polysaccharide/polyol phosphate export permease
VIKIDIGDTRYALFTLAGLIPWTYFTSSLTFGIPSIWNNQSLIRRLAFPRASLPLSAVGISLIDLGVASLLFFIATYWIGDGLHASIVWFPVLLLLETIFVSGVVLAGSALNAFASDVRLLIPVSTQLLLFVTPVMYPMSLVPERYQDLFRLNPMTGFVESFRRILVFGQGPTLETLGPSLIGAVVALLLGVWYFRATEARFADVV